jgi:hypothetical protein
MVLMVNASGEANARATGRQRVERSELPQKATLAAGFFLLLSPQLVVLFFSFSHRNLICNPS